MFTNSKLANSVRLAVAFGAAAATAVTSNAVAQEAEAEGVEKIAVTGSRIKRTDLESASPISVFSAEDLAATGLTTLEDFVQSLPAMNGGALGSTVNNGNAGFASVALRGLGSNRTLVLVNGRRFQSADLNVIPVSFIERVEVLRDGASTIYGSDAIAGVVNFVTKRDFEGVEVAAQYDITDKDDGEIFKFSLTTGASSDKGNVIFGLEYTKRDAISQGGRDYSNCPITEDVVAGELTKVCGGSGTTYPGHAFPMSGGDFIVDNGVPRPFVTSDSFNYAEVSYQVTPQEIWSMSANSTYEISDNVLAFTEANYTNRVSQQLMAPLGTFWFPLVPESNPGNVFGEDTYVARRLVETGGRHFTQDVSEYRMVFGFEGTFANDWSWDVAYNYAKFTDLRANEGFGNPVRFQHLLDPALCAANNCPGVWDPFVTNSLTQDMMDYALVLNSPVQRGRTTQFIANISGDFGDIELPGGPIQWAAGYEHHSEMLDNRPDGAASINQIYGVAANPTQGQYHVKEAYIEFNLPVLADLPMIQSLNIIAASRYSDFSNLADTTTNSKFGIEWTPIDGLLVRATQADGFRAPNISEMFLPQQQSNVSYNDPCINWGSSANANVRANCSAEGLPSNFTLSSDQATTVIGGNPDLTPEESESFTAGFVYTPDFIEGLSMSVDYFDIEITNGIGTAGVDNIVTGCYTSANFSSPFCDLIVGPSHPVGGGAPHPTASGTRDVLGNVVGILATQANLSTFETSGFDFDFNYKTEILNGSLNLTMAGTVLEDYDYLPFEGGDLVSTAGYFAVDQTTGNPATFSELRANFSVGYTTDDFAINWTTRYQSEVEDINIKAGPTGNFDDVAEAVWYHDLQGSYYMDGYTFSAGVRNLGDEEPPYVTNYDDMNTIPQSFDLAGRYYYVRFNAKF